MTLLWTVLALIVGIAIGVVLVVRGANSWVPPWWR